MFNIFSQNFTHPTTNQLSVLNSIWNDKSEMVRRVHIYSLLSVQDYRSCKLQSSATGAPLQSDVQNLSVQNLFYFTSDKKWKQKEFAKISDTVRGFVISPVA